MPLHNALDFLTDAAPADRPPVVVIFGGDRTLRTWVIGRLEEDESTRLDGEVAAWRDVRDALSSPSLFTSGDRQLVVVRDADALVKQSRSDLEDYLQRPADSGRLIVEVSALPANTRLYKAAAKSHLLIEAAVPKAGRSNRPDVSKLRQFLVATLAPRHRCRLANTAADLLIDLVGPDVGMLDTEIAKLAVYLPPEGEITEALVREIVGGWRGKTMWEIIDAVAAGDAAEALRHVDRLLASGQRPIALLPQLAWSLRRLGLAAAAIDHAERTGRRMSLGEALRAAGVPTYGNELKKAETQLRGLGRSRARRLLGWLLETDLKLKGSHSADGPDRMALEELFLRLAKGA